MARPYADGVENARAVIGKTHEHEALIADLARGIKSDPSSDRGFMQVRKQTRRTDEQPSKGAVHPALLLGCA